MIKCSWLAFLSYAAVYPNLGGRTKRQAWRRLKKEARQMKKRANHFPANVSHLHALMEAEMHRLRGSMDKSLSCYATAIGHAKENGFRRDEAPKTSSAGVCLAVSPTNEFPLSACSSRAPAAQAKTGTGSQKVDKLECRCDARSDSS